MTSFRSGFTGFFGLLFWFAGFLLAAVVFLFALGVLGGALGRISG